MSAIAAAGRAVQAQIRAYSSLNLKGWINYRQRQRKADREPKNSPPPPVYKGR